MNNNKEVDPENLGGLGDMLPADVLEKLNQLLEMLHQTEGDKKGSTVINIYAQGSQHVDTQINIGASPLTPLQRARGTLRARGVDRSATASHSAHHKGGELEECIRQSIALLMEERYGDEPLFNLQAHWQAVYRILVDKGYCRDSDFDGFDAFIRRVMPEEVNKPYKKDSVKQISQTDFVKAFDKWAFDTVTSKTHKPFDRMVAVAQRFRRILEEKGL